MPQLVGHLVLADLEPGDRMAKTRKRQTIRFAIRLRKGSAGDTDNVLVGNIGQRQPFRVQCHIRGDRIDRKIPCRHASGIFNRLLKKQPNFLKFYS